MTINSDDVQFVLNKQRSFKITLGSIFGILLSLYFYSFATLLDKAPKSFFYFEVITGIAMAVGLFTLNKISFAYIHKRFNGKMEYRSWIGKLRADDVDKKFERVITELESR